MERFVVLQKAVGETPLSCLESWRAKRPEMASLPLAYAGRLDPMASGKLLVLIGDECKQQIEYHALDKEYEFSVLFGVGSDTGDVLGRLRAPGVAHLPPFDRQGPSLPIIPGDITPARLADIAKNLVGEITFPYPLFSAKTVNGKPLHVWTLEGRLDEISIPTRTAHIYTLEHTRNESIVRTEMARAALKKIETIPSVIDERKVLGNDFRRVHVRQDWEVVLNDTTAPHEYVIAHFRAATSSGMYMRTLAEKIAQACGTIGLAWHIHRSAIGLYDDATKLWKNQF